MRSSIVILLTVLFFTACKKQDDNTAYKTMQDQAYGTDPKQKMDIYLPAHRSADTTKVLFLIHGGGWTEGDKADFNSFVIAIQSLFPNYAIFNINYRLFANNQNLFPAQENDVKAAVEFVAAKRNEFLISDKWAFLGASAGGHLALLQSYKYSSPVKPKAVISFFGPTDLTALYNDWSNPLISILLAQVTGATPSTNSTVYQQSSPVTFVNAQSCPTLLLQGGQDPLVPVSQATALRDKLQAMTVPNQYFFYPNDGHGWQGADLLDSFDKIGAFLKQYVN
jgi:acetyl esterase/lipase